MKPHCESFKPTPTAEWLCAKWIHPRAGLMCTFFCRDGKVCETAGKRDLPDQEEE